VPLNSVQLYVASLLDGLAIPGNPTPLTAHITPPTVEDLDGPRAYVWGARLNGLRQTAPRGPGFKRLNWVVDVYLSYETVPDDPTVDQNFPLIVDAVMNATWQTVMPTFITDPQTGVKSQILQIGEEFELEYPPERTPATLRMLYFTARLGLDVYEAVQA
jgi:hypothetical protein